MTVQAFWALEDPCCRCIWLQGYLFRAQKQKKYRLTSFFVFNHTDKCDGIRFSTKCCVVFQLRSLMFKQRQRWWQNRLCELSNVLAAGVQSFKDTNSKLRNGRQVSQFFILSPILRDYWLRKHLGEQYLLADSLFGCILRLNLWKMSIWPSRPS